MNAKTASPPVSRIGSLAAATVAAVIAVVVTVLTGLSLTSAPAGASVPQYVRQPSWLYIDYASRVQRQETCGYWPHTRTLIPGVLVTSGDTAVMFCKNGKAYPS
jgi:hypothetical protein